ncbi:hypothetical protein C3L57_06845 [Veillonellaceae bacterium M2-8]|nr:hypothetical protein [Veillonellaceae bacterium M2-8]
MISETRFTITYKINKEKKYPYPYYYESTDDIKGYLIDDTGYKSLITTDYYFDKATNVFIYPISDTEVTQKEIMLVRQTPIISNLSVPIGYPYKGIEQEFTKHTMWIQELSQGVTDTHNDKIAVLNKAKEVEQIKTAFSTEKQQLLKRMQNQSNELNQMQEDTFRTLRETQEVKAETEKVRDESKTIAENQRAEGNQFKAFISNQRGEINDNLQRGIESLQRTTIESLEELSKNKNAHISELNNQKEKAIEYINNTVSDKITDVTKTLNTEKEVVNQKWENISVSVDNLKAKVDKATIDVSNCKQSIERETNAITQIITTGKLDLNTVATNKKQEIETLATQKKQIVEQLAITTKKQADISKEQADTAKAQADNAKRYSDTTRQYKDDTVNINASTKEIAKQINSDKEEVKAVALNATKVKEYTEQAHNSAVLAKKYAEQTKQTQQGNFVKSVNSILPDSKGNIALDLSIYAPMSYVDTATKKAVDGVNQSFETKLNAYQSTVTNKIATSKSNFDEILKDYARKTDVPHQIDLSGYATKEQITTVAENISAAQNSLNAVNQHINNLNNTASILRSDIKSNKSILNNIGNIYAKKSDIPDMSRYAKKSDIPDMSRYAKVTDIPSLSGYVQRSELSGYAKATDIPSLSNYVQRSDLNEYAKKSDIPDMSIYVKKSDIPSGTTVDDYCVPDGTETVTAEMFEKYHLTEKVYLAFPPSVKTIVDFNDINHPFKGKKQLLMAVTLPQCTAIGEYTFKSCSSLTTVSLPHCTYIGDNAFDRCSSLMTVSFLACIRVNEYTFKSCSSLTTVSLPNCTAVDKYAFDGCDSLTTVLLPKCTYINDNSFGGCFNLTTLIVSKEMPPSLINEVGIPSNCRVYDETKRYKIVNGMWKKVAYEHF